MRISELKTTKEVAYKLCIPVSILRNNVSTGIIPKPKIRIGMSFLWTPEEVEMARQIRNKISTGDNRRAGQKAAFLMLENTNEAEK